MRALCVGRAAEASEACLLGTVVGLRWPRGFGVEGAVQALVRPVRLRSPRFNALMADAERDPPTESVLRPPKAGVATGGPLAVRMASGRPYSWNRRSTRGRASPGFVESRAEPLQRTRR